jgi:hypothetical protein
MNSPDHKFVDDFDAPEMQPAAAAIVKGAHIIYAHTALQRRAGMGYLSEWAGDRLPSPRERNAFFEEIGRRLQPGHEQRLETVTEAATPDDILDRVGR